MNLAEELYITPFPRGNRDRQSPGQTTCRPAFAGMKEEKRCCRKNRPRTNGDERQGFAFIMLVTGQIHHAMIKAQQKLHDNTTSIYDLLLKARALKLEKRGNYWQLRNARKKDLEVLEKVGFKPQERIQA